MEATTILLIFIPLAAVIVHILIAVKYKSVSGSISNARKRRYEKKERSKKMVLNLFHKQEHITNNDVERLLEVSDATATNYLSELEEEEEIIQQGGETGRNVSYTKR